MLHLKNAFFELYGIIIQTIYLLISMDIYIFLFISIIFILKFVNINIIKNIGIYIYIPIFLIIVAIFSNVKTIRKYAIIISIFSFIIILAAIWIKKINKIKYKTNLITIKFKIITRNILKTKLRLVEHIFPIYILIHIFTYQIYVYLTNRYFISIRNNVLENSIFLVYYFFLYYLYLKRKILSLDECFYFYITKIERYKSSILKSYFMEISKIISFNIFNIFWGMVIFNKFFTSSNTENNIIFICSQIFISILAISSDIYVYKNKLEVINKPEDLKKYMSFIEGMFLVILLTVVQLIIYSSTEIKSNILIEYLRLDSINLIFNILFGILAVIAIIKSLNFMVINKFNMVRGKK